MRRSINQRCERFGLLAGVILLIAGAFTVRKAAGESENANWEEGYGEFARVFAEVYRLIETDYYEERDPDVLFRAAINGMMRSLDPHSQYLPPDSFKQLEKDTGAEFSGIGIHISRRDGLLTVIAPIPGGPSALSGIQPWDRIVEVEGESTEEMSITDAIKRITGPVGTDVTIKVWRPGLREPETHTLTRAKIRIENVFSKNLGGGVGLIRLSKFSDRGAAEVAGILEKFRDEGVKSLVIDLRFNTGGLLDEAIALSDLFLPPGSMIVSTRGRGGRVEQEFKAKRAALVEWPLAILVNNGSASASEIFAAAMHDHKLAALIGPKGENTFGKGSVQTVIPQNYSFERDDQGNYAYGGYRLTTALYYTPSGETIHGKGIKPDVGVEVSIEQKRKLLAYGLIGGPDMSGPHAREVLGADGEDEAPSSDGAETMGEALDNVDGEVEMAPDGEEGEEHSFFDKDITTPEIFESAADFVDVELEEARRLLVATIALEESPEGQIDEWADLETAPELNLGELAEPTRRAILALAPGKHGLPLEPLAEEDEAADERAPMFSDDGDE